MCQGSTTRNPHPILVRVRQNEGKHYRMINLNVEVVDNIKVLNVHIEGGIANFFELPRLTIPEVAGQHGLIISGRAPGWLIGFLVGKVINQVAWLGIHKPGGRVIVVASPSGSIPVGEVLDITIPTRTRPVGPVVNIEL